MKDLEQSSGREIPASHATQVMPKRKYMCQYQARPALPGNCALTLANNSQPTKMPWVRMLQFVLMQSL